MPGIAGLINRTGNTGTGGTYSYTGGASTAIPDNRLNGNSYNVPSNVIVELTNGDSYGGYGNANEQSIYDAISSANQSSGNNTTGSAIHTGLGKTVDKKLNNAIDHPGETAGNIIGRLLTSGGVSDLGTVIKDLYNEHVTNNDHGTGLTDREMALYSGDTQIPSNTSTSATPKVTARADAPVDETYRGDPLSTNYGDSTGFEPINMNAVNALRVNNPVGPDYSGINNANFGPGSLSNAFTGVGDMNAINFMTGSPTSMTSQADVDAYNTLYGSGKGDTYAPGQTFADQNKDLYKYAAEHEVPGFNDYAAGYLSPVGKAEYANQTPHEKSAEEQQMLDDYYNQLYGEVPMAAGGLASLPEYKAGGLLHGPGDGMSDSIPAVIKGEQPQRAALADGEFVVPADVVSHLGNGSTKAGSARLYEMMDKIRQARTGNPKQGKKINPHKFLPI